jgi:hypothetical protein
MTYLNAVAMLVLVLSPVLVPLVITGVHAIADWRQKYKRFRANIHPQRRATSSVAMDDLEDLSIAR